MAKRRTIITIEKHSQVFLRIRGQSQGLRCPACDEFAPLMTVEQAAVVLSVTQRAIFRLIEQDLVHFAETAKGELLICMDSLRHLENSGKNEKGEM